MSNTKMVPAWVIQRDDRDVEGPFFLQSAALMRLASMPGCKVVRREVMVEESSVMHNVREAKDFDV